MMSAYSKRNSRPIAAMMSGPSVGAGLFSLLSLIERLCRVGLCTWAARIAGKFVITTRPIGSTCQESQAPNPAPHILRGRGAGSMPSIFTISLPIPRSLWNGPISRGIVFSCRRECFCGPKFRVCQFPRETLHLASDPPTKPLLDVPCDPTYVPPDPTPNAASDEPRELPNGVVWW
jgi:hypothetical protein